ncbi:MAG: SDR family oxidoreductase [Rhodospirillaceae bacterium]|nr:MAG: SDR family oxidoreductase [Rhodospirillaceae bacterium]
MQRQPEHDLSGKVAIVTGGSRGIGKHTALMLARRGVNVVVAARTVDPDSVLPGTIGETVAQIEALGVGALAVQTDLSKEEDLRRLVQATVDRFGGVDILINNAAVTQLDSWSASLLEIPREDWLYQFAVNVHSVFTLTQLVVPIMEARGGGRILNVTTGSAEAFRQPEEPLPLEAVGDFKLTASAYFSSKRAMDRFANVVASELARKNIYIITMLPGFVASEITVWKVENAGLDGSQMIPMDVPARMLTYFAACENPAEYMGRIFWAERELKALGIELD